MKQIALLLAAVGACGGSPQIPPAEPSTPPVSTAPSAGASQTPAVTPPPAAGPQPGVMAASSASPPRSATAPSPIVDAPDRSDQDRALDPGRHPLELLAFAGIKPGMHVADLQAGGGYTTEILARAVGPGGVVYSQNNKFVASRAEKPWSERLAKPALANVKRVDRELGDPLPPQAHDLDAVFLVLFYHDAVWMGADLDKMNRAIFAALKPGGEYIVVDHSAQEGSGVRDVKTFHRIDERTVEDQISRAGFRLAQSADFLRNPKDARDWNDSPSAAGDRRGTSDRFVLKFVRPEAH